MGATTNTSTTDRQGITPPPAPTYRNPFAEHTFTTRPNTWADLAATGTTLTAHSISRLNDALVHEQEEWEYNRIRYDAAAQNPAVIPFWFHDRVDAWAAREGLPLIDWTATTLGGAA